MTGEISVVRYTDGVCQNPSLAHFRAAYNYAHLNGIVSKSKGANCQLDIAEHLFAPGEISEEL